jgi:hypothetical protein
MNTKTEPSIADQRTVLFASGLNSSNEQTTDSSTSCSAAGPVVHEIGKDGHRIVQRPLKGLRLHPAFVKYGLGLSPTRLTATARYGDLSKPNLILITRNNILLKGHETLQSALQNGVEQLFCPEYDYTDDEALLWILKQSQMSHQLNSFQRILLALELEPSLHERARENQRSGGKLKGSANLTEDQIIDCRHEIAVAAGVCDANVGKVRKLIQAQDDEVLRSLHAGEVSINRASRWLNCPQERSEYLEKQGERSIKRCVRAILRLHRKRVKDRPDVQRIGRKLGAMHSDQISSICAVVIPYRESIICISEGLLRDLETQGVL